MGIANFIAKLNDVVTTHFRKREATEIIYVVEMPEYGNISSNNIIGITSNLFNSFEENLYAKRTIAHELIHPFVQIPTLESNPMYALIMEGFPSFFQWYALRKTDNISEMQFEDYMRKTQDSYIKKRIEGKDRRGNPLPKEKAILNISAKEISIYKDVFVLSDRVWLFLYHLYRKMGTKTYDAFLKELFVLNGLTYKDFESLVIKYLPDYKKDLVIWLNTTDYPNRLKI